MNQSQNDGYILNNSVADIFSSRLDGQIINKLISIALAKGGEFADIYAQYSVANAVSLEEKKLKQARTGIVQGVGIRVISGDKTGYAYSDSFDFEDLKRAAETASAIALSDNSKDNNPVVEKVSSPRSLKNDMNAAPLKLKVDLLWRANDAGYSEDLGVIQVMASLADSEKYVRIANSEGLFVDNHQSLNRFNVSVILEDGKQRQTGYHGGGGRIGYELFEKFTPEQMAKEAVRVARVRMKAREAPAGPMEVVLGNGWAGVLLHESVGHGLEADFNRKKTSLYSGRMGQKVASDLVTVVDDGQIPMRRGSIVIDDEGTESSRNVLIENGILKGFLYDKLNARLMDTKSTGSGRRQSYKHYPMPRMTNTFMTPGEATPDDIIKSVKKGLLAMSFGGGQVDISNGQFVFEVIEGYLIEDGLITTPVKGASLIGNGPQVLEKVEMVGNDFALDSGIGTCGKNGQSVPVGVGTPTCKISEITVGGTEISGRSLAGGKQ